MNGPMREDVTLRFRAENAEEATAMAMRWATDEPDVSSARLVRVEQSTTFPTAWAVTLEIRWRTVGAWLGEAAR
jgi:hypothetical protein